MAEILHDEGVPIGQTEINDTDDSEEDIADDPAKKSATFIV